MKHAVLRSIRCHDNFPQHFLFQLIFNFLDRFAMARDGKMLFLPMKENIETKIGPFLIRCVGFELDFLPNYFLLMN